MRSVAEHFDLLITNAVVVTMDSRRRILDPGHVAIRDGRIAAAGVGVRPPPGTTSDRTVDAKGGIVHPGLIDAHAHVAWGLARCFVPDSFSEDEVFTRFDAPMLACVSDDDEHIGTKLACLEMALNGTTCFADTGSAMRDLAPSVEAVDAVGLRGMVSYLNADSIDAATGLNAPLDRCLERIEDGLKRFPLRETRAWACAGLIGMETATDALVREAKALADGHGVSLNLHKSFTPAEVDQRRQRLNGRDPLAGFADLGVLSPNVTLVHMNVASDAEVRLLVEARSCVVHCPTASMMYGIGGSRLGRFPELVSARASVALGTDSTHWQNAWDLTRSVYLAATLHKEARGERPLISAEDALEMATIHGASAVGRASELGSLEPGKLADLVVHGVHRPEAHPSLDVIGTLVYSLQARAVRTVVVGGEIIVDEGEPRRVDREKILGESDRAAVSLAKRLGYTPTARWPTVRRETAIRG